jgi:predicted RNase H-like HicB family nuclease
MKTYRYEIIIFWSKEDDAFVADVPELPGCMAHGTTHETALREAKKAISLWIEMAEAKGRPVPEPKGRRLLFA